MLACSCARRREEEPYGRSVDFGASSEQFDNEAGSPLLGCYVKGSPLHMTQAPALRSNSHPDVVEVVEAERVPTARVASSHQQRGTKCLVSVRA
jgi:hypothetical protein